MSETPTGIPPKRDVTRALLLRGSVFVHLDPRVEGVVVPASFHEQSQLVLQVGLDLPVPIPDLRIDEDGIHGTLSFSRSPFTCFLPWNAVFALVGDDGKGMVFPDALPEEIAREIASTPPEPAAAPKRKKTPASRIVPGGGPVLHAVPDGSKRPAAKRPTATTAKAKAGKAAPSPGPKPAVIRANSDTPTAVTPAPKMAPRTSAGGSKKRELPPYLRVVK